MIEHEVSFEEIRRIQAKIGDALIDETSSYDCYLAVALGLVTLIAGMVESEAEGHSTIETIASAMHRAIRMEFADRRRGH